MTADSPSMALARYVRATLVCRDLKVNSRTASRAIIEQIAYTLLSNGHTEIDGYDARTVRAILLGKTAHATPARS